MTNDRSPEDWEAIDHIENLKAGIPKPGQKIPGVCEYHSAQACALIWMIRRMDKEGKSGVKLMLPASGGAALIVAFIEGVKYLLQ
jgi:hypothetical protein